MEKPTLYSALKNIEGMPKTQVNIFEHYRGNEYLERAIHREQSLKDVCTELTASFQGINSYLPHFRDSAHNERVKRMGELIPANGLYQNGVYYPDNKVTAIGYAAISVFAPMMGQALKEQGHELVGAFVVGGLAMAGFGGFWFGFFSSRGRYVNHSLMSATYIDCLIKELEIK
jgi:hypothetical protein